MKLSRLIRFLFVPLLLVAVVVPAQADHEATPSEHLVPVPARHGHRILLSDQLLQGAKLAQSERSGAASSQRRASGAAVGRSAVAPFLTRPYWNWHAVNSVFDHCNPDYSLDGQICEVDGTVAKSSYGSDPSFTAGYATSPGGSNYLYYDGHNGWDIALNYENLIAAAPGVVTIAGVDPNNVGFGETVVIDHGNGFSTRYGHMSQIWVSVGQHVGRGQGIGVSGNTGYSTGPHLHFGLYLNNSWTAIDPWGWAGNYSDPWPADAGNLWITGNPQNPVPVAPTNVHAVPYPAGVIVSWNAPSFDGGDAISNYRVVASPGNIGVTVPGNSTSAAMTGLRAGTKYTFTVTASTDVGSSPASSASNAVTATGGSLGGLSLSTPVATSSGANHMDLFVRGTDSALYHMWWDGSSWHGWENLGEIVSSGLTATSWGSNRIDVFFLAPDHSAWHKWYDGTWHHEALGGYFTSDLSATSWANRLDVFGRGGDNALWQISWYGASWSMQSVGGLLASAPHAVSASAGRIDVFVKGIDSAVWQIAYTGAWWPWSPLGGTMVGDPAPVETTSGSIEVFARGSDNALWHSWWTGAGWSAWQSLGGILNSSPMATADGSRRDVFVLGVDGYAWEVASSGTWGSWSSLGHTSNGQIGAIDPAPGIVDVFALGTDDSVWQAQVTY